jgi:probable HAF family extracellular repeat protein
MLSLVTAEKASAAYSFSDVDYPGAVWTVAQKINDSGQIVGYYADTSGVRHGFLLSGGTYTIIDCPSPYTASSNALGINNLGQIVGSCSAPGGVNGVYGSTRSFILSGGVLTFLADAPGSYGGASTFAQGIDDSGQIVGFYADGCLCNGHGFLLSGGIFTTLDVPGFGSTYARAINNPGEIVGGTQPTFGGGNEQGFTLNNGIYTNFNDPATGATSGTEANGINDFGQSVGYYQDASNVLHGFLLDSGVFSDIDHPNAQLTEALGINSSGQVVGVYTDLANVQHGFVTAPPAPTTQIQALIASTLMTNLAANIQSQLDAKLDAALQTLDAARKNSASTAANQLQAFVNAVTADVQSGKITCAQATALVTAAQNVVAALGQPPLSVSLPCH